MQIQKVDKLKGSAVLVTLALAQFASAQFLYSAYSSDEFMHALHSVQLTAPPIASLVQIFSPHKHKLDE